MASHDLELNISLYSTITQFYNSTVINRSTSNGYSSVSSAYNISTSASETWTNIPENITKSKDNKILTLEEMERGIISWDDATWILTSSFIVFTMQSGFGLLEAGCVSSKNEVNIMVKNAVDVIFGGLAYWMFGYGLSFGEGRFANGFCGWGDFFVDNKNETDMGLIYSNFIFQLSFATTATTIVSGAMAERTKLSAYTAFSFLNTLVYCIPAHWIWSPRGFLHTMGCVDIAGSGGVHLVGGVSALVATMILQPRLGRFKSDDGEVITDKHNDLPMGNATNALVGMFMLWWGWLGFNCGSTFGISYGKWKLAAKAAVNTICTSMGGGVTAISFGSSVTTIACSVGGGVSGFYFSYWWRNNIYNVKDLINSILGSLVSITAGCAVIHPWEAIIIGAIGSLLTILATDLIAWIKIDDPVGAIPVHGFAGIWGLLAIGLFIETEPVMQLHNGEKGLFKGGGFHSLGIQTLAIVCIIAWASMVSFILLMGIKFTIGLRLTEYEERMGSDFIEHGIKQQDITQAQYTPHCCHCKEHTNSRHSPRRRTSFGFSRTMDDILTPSELLPYNIYSGSSEGVVHSEENGNVAVAGSDRLRSSSIGSLRNGQVWNRNLELPTITESTNNIVENGQLNNGFIK